MIKRMRMFLPILMVLAMVSSLFGVATPVMASMITVVKDVTNPYVVNIYYVGDTIYYAMEVQNPASNTKTNTLTRIWDTLPDGTIVEFLGVGETLVQAPGAVKSYNITYVVREADIRWIIPPDPTKPPYWGVTNKFEAEGYDSAGDRLYGLVFKSSQVIRPKLSINKTVDFNGDGVYSDLEANKPGSTASWNVTVCNMGYDPVYDITVTDTNGHGFGAAFNLSVGECRTFIYDMAMNVTTVNGATAVGYDVKGSPVGPVRDDAKVVVVDARISIAPLEDTNAVGADHPLTATVQVDHGDGSGWQAYAGANVTFAVIDGVGSVAPTSDITDSAGEARTVLTSLVTGNSTVQASTSIIVGGLVFSLVTNGIMPNSGPAEKDWVRAKIEISPLEDTNKVGDDHDLTACVYVDTGSGYALYTEPITINFSKVGVGSLNATSVPTTTGCAETTLTSAVPGTSTVTAQCAFSVGGVPFNISTNGSGDNSAPAEKTWVDARISIAPSGTNKVSDSHNFTVTVEKNDGTGWTAASNVSVTASLTGVGSITSANPATTGGTGQVTFTVNSAVVGTATVHASGTVSVGGISIAVATNGYGAHIVQNQKTWVDARISIRESGTNPVNTPHTFTVTVEKNDGTGWTPASGVSVTASLSGVGSITSANPATTGGTGQVTFTVNSAVAGTATVHASATVNVGGVAIDVATNGYGAYVVSNVKTWTAQCTGCLKICKFEDKNGNGKKDRGEPWLSGWVFNITGPGGYSRSVTTGGSGDVGVMCDPRDYCVTICDLAPGEYTVTETLKPGWTCTTGNPRIVTVECDRTTTVAFGNKKLCLGSIKIYKFNDRNGNGKRDWGEAFLSGWVFTVTDSQGNSWSGTTGIGGHVTIPNLAPGVYTVTETLKPGWTCTTGNPIEVTVVTGQRKIVYFGNKRLGGPCG